MSVSKKQRRSSRSYYSRKAMAMQHFSKVQYQSLTGLPKGKESQSIFLSLISKMISKLGFKRQKIA